MSASIDRVVRVLITKGSRQIPLANFGIPAIFGPSNRFPELSRVYTSPDDMLLDGFQTSDPEYIHAVALMSQSVQVERFYIAKYTTPVAQVNTVSIASILNATLYRVTLNGVNCDYTSDADATGAEIQAGLIAAINGSSQAGVLTATAGTGTDVVITSDVAGLGFSIAVGANLTQVETTPNHSIVDDIVAQRQLDDGWYGLICTSKVSSDILQIATYIEAQKKIYGVTSSEAGILTGSTTDIMSQLQDRAFERSWLLYKGSPAAGGDAAWFGRLFPTGVGAATWKFKQLRGQTSDDLTEAQITNAAAKNANMYLQIGGVDITTEGVLASGEYIDVTRGIDALEATMQVNVYSLLVNNDKVPYTNKGIATVENAVRQTLQEFEDNGFLAPGWTVSVPDVLSVSQADKASRTLNNVVFTATLAGAIHKVNIQGFVSV